MDRKEMIRRLREFSEARSAQIAYPRIMQDVRKTTPEAYALKMLYDPNDYDCTDKRIIANFPAAKYPEGYRPASVPFNGTNDLREAKTTAIRELSDKAKQMQKAFESEKENDEKELKKYERDERSFWKNNPSVCFIASLIVLPVVFGSKLVSSTMESSDVITAVIVWFIFWSVSVAKEEKIAFKLVKALPFLDISRHYHK